MKKNDIIRVTVTSVTIQGYGIAKDESGLTVFISNAAMGDVLDVRVLKVKKTYAYAKIENIVVGSQDRVKVDCSKAYRCGGCLFRHIDYKSELGLKRQAVVDSIERIAGLRDVLVEEIVAAPHVNRYRNKAILPITTNRNGDVEIGFFASNTHRVVSCEDCLLQPEVFTKIVGILKKWMSLYNVSAYEERTRKGILRNLYIRIAEFTGEIMICLVANAKKVPFEKKFIEMIINDVSQVRSVWVNVNTKDTNVVMGEECRLVWGAETIEDVLCGLRFKISPLSFYQVNRKQTERLYSLAMECADLNKNDVLLDLYCGIGTIGLTMSKHVKKMIGADIVKQSIDNARQNAAINDINNAEFLLADASDAVKIIEERNEKINVMVIDPPRKGCSVSVIETIVRMSPDRIVYISCNPATLARDLKIFCESKYDLKKVIPVDMFPRTGHVETVVLMSRRRK